MESKVTFGSSTTSFKISSGTDVTSTGDGIWIRAEDSNGNTYGLLAVISNLMFQKVSPSGEVTNIWTK